MKRIALTASMLLCAVTMFLTGCGKPAVVHASTPEEFAKSYQEMTADLEPAKKAQFDAALAKLVAFSTKGKQNKKLEEVQMQVYSGLEGMNVDEVIQTAGSLR